MARVNDLYKTFTDHNATYSSIQQWITPEFKQLLLQTVAHLSVEAGLTNHNLGGRFDRFHDVLIADTTDCTLSRVSFDDFPGYSADHAGSQLHMIESLGSRAPIAASITDVRTDELDELQVED